MGKKKLICGVGVNDLDSASRIDGDHSSAYHCWHDMITRCYGNQNKTPTYVGCYVCDEWLVFSKFKEWYDLNYVPGFHLDKDILIENNKIYSPNTCIFVPVYINVLLVDRRNDRGSLPLGISFGNYLNNKGEIVISYKASCNNGNGKRLSKRFCRLEDAMDWYSNTKKRIVAQQVSRALSEEAISQTVADALLRREF